MACRRKDKAAGGGGGAADRNSTTGYQKTHFCAFIAECRRLQSLLGMTEWRLAFRYETPSDPECLAWASLEPVDRFATLSLSRAPMPPRHRECPPSPEVLATHEMMEILLFPLTQMALTTYAQPRVMQHLHSIIRRMEPLRLTPRTEETLTCITRI